MGIIIRSIKDWFGAISMNIKTFVKSLLIISLLVPTFGCETVDIVAPFPIPHSPDAGSR